MHRVVDQEVLLDGHLNLDLDWNLDGLLDGHLNLDFNRYLLLDFDCDRLWLACD